MTSAGCVRLADIHRPLSLFAQGLAGRYLHLKVRQSKPGEDGDSIRLPPRIEDFSSTAHNSGVYRIEVLRQISYLLDGIVGFDIQVASRKLSLFATPARSSSAHSDLELFFARWSRPMLLRKVFFLLEAVRIDCIVWRRYPGARADLHRVGARALTGRAIIEAHRPLPILIEALIRYSLGADRSMLVATDRTGRLEGLLELADQVREQTADVYCCARIALSICVALDPDFRSRTFLIKEGDTGSEPIATTTQYLPEQDELDGLAIDFRAELMSELALSQRRGGQVGSLPADARVPMTSGNADGSDAQLKDVQHGNAASSASRASRPSAADSSRSYFYDEWDYHRHGYLKGWCTLFEQTLQGVDSGFIDDVHRRHRLLARQVRRQFGFIRPESWRRVRRTSDGDELELDAVIDAVIDQRTTGASDSQLYVRRDRALRDVAAVFLMDMSASTGYPLPEPAPAVPAPAAEISPYLYGGLDDLPKRIDEPKRRVIDVAKDALALMCEALQRSGDSYAMYGFSGDGHDHVDFHIVKDFDDRLSGQTWAALAAMQPLRSTRMGTAVRHAVLKLTAQAARMKILIIVSDGYPQDHDYGPDRMDDRYGIEDTACALREAERAGVNAFCVTIDPAGHDYLRRMCPESRYMVIDDVTALPRELTKVYQTLTAR